MKERFDNLSFVRAVSCMGIVGYHFFYEYRACSAFSAGVASAIGLSSSFLVSVFFMLSGGLLYYHNPKIVSLKHFYRKRAESIYPAFYITFAIGFLMWVILTKSFFYKSGEAHPASLLLSLLGLDGYLKYLIPNYYICGEWFLGAIIIIYALYPFLLHGFQTRPWGWLLLYTVGMLLSCNIHFFTISPDRNLLSCIFRFYLGMALMKYRQKLESLLSLVISFVMTMLLRYCILPMAVSPFWHFLILDALIPPFLFVFLANLGIYVMKIGILKKFFLFISDISYPVFLTHHVIILLLYMIFPPASGLGLAISFLLAITVTLVSSVILKTVTSKLMHTAFPLKLRRGASAN